MLLDLIVCAMLAAALVCQCVSLLTVLAH